MAAEIIAALLSKIDDTGLPDIEGLTKEEQAESVDHLINEANTSSKQTISAMVRKKRSKKGRKKKVKPADNVSDSEKLVRQALQVRKALAPMIKKLSQKKNYPRHGWVTKDQTSDEEVGVFTRTLISNSDISSSETDTGEEDHDRPVLTE